MLDTNSRDKELWELSKQGNKVAYSLLYKQYVQLVVSEINKRINNRIDAEDLTQEIFLTLWEKRTTVEIENRVYSYLYGMVQYTVFNYFRNKKIQSKQLRIWQTLLDDNIIQLPEAAGRLSSINNMECILNEEHSRLPQKMRTIYELRYIKKKSIEWISQDLNISPNTVRNHLKEARKRFSLALKKSFFLLFFLCCVLLFHFYLNLTRYLITLLPANPECLMLPNS
ncbi:RNA polymerase sigma factor [Chitinophaga defluvii]|uniref:Sigma-70 family RNA polymerase sigma factor n=1 Tax=Chitinophaga defluvii TaxID=3163343 RepID=A0ABV2T5E7_9BACT